MTTSSTLFCFDFDQTLILDNSDTHVPEALHSQSALLALKSATLATWNRQVDQALLLMQETCSAADISRAAETVPFDPEMLECAELAAQTGQAIILSDANDVYVRAFCDKHLPAHTFAQILTNPTYVDADGKLRIAPFHSHACPHCPPNMCKTLALKTYISSSSRAFDRIVYFGDGYGDYCPVANVLSERDVAMVRFDAGAPSAQTLKRLIDKKGGVQCKIELWARGRDCLSRMRGLLL
jgi:pyridoxal phosphate phosphatase PHOSPHO2